VFISLNLIVYLIILVNGWVDFLFFFVCHSKMNILNQLTTHLWVINNGNEEKELKKAQG